jgi:hypothetical protein
MKGSVVTLGEIMRRLSPPGRERLLQRPRLTATFGGAEANVAVSLARFGLYAAFVTVPFPAIRSPMPVSPSCAARAWMYPTSCVGQAAWGSTSSSRVSTGRTPGMIS